MIASRDQARENVSDLDHGELLSVADILAALDSDRQTKSSIDIFYLSVRICRCRSRTPRAPACGALRTHPGCGARTGRGRGWDAVTTRRLAGLIDYSQPVLYSHFKNKADIMAAVAHRGFEELARRLKAATARGTGDPGVLRNVCAAYLDFANARPVVYEAMFILPTNIKFASEQTPPSLRAGFAALVTALGADRKGSEFGQNSWPKCCGVRCMDWSSSRSPDVSRLQAPRLD